jgi:hypothetical protein
MIVIVLAGEEWTLRSKAESPGFPPWHYTQRKVRNRQPRFVTLCGHNLGAYVVDAPSDTPTDQTCRRCWDLAMAQSAAEAKKKAFEVWAGSGACLVKATKRGAGLVRKRRQ